MLRQRGHEVLLFVSEKEIDSLALSTRSQFRFEKLPTVGFPSLHSPRIFGFIRRFTESLALCRSIYKKFKPQVVLGMGGFTSTAPILAGRMRGISTLVHESNAIPGKANRLAAKMVGAVLLGFKEAAQFFPKARTEITGTPIRNELKRVDKEVGASKAWIASRRNDDAGDGRKSGGKRNQPGHDKIAAIASRCNAPSDSSLRHSRRTAW